MKMFKTLYFFSFFILFPVALHAQYISVTENLTTVELVEDVLVANSCANVSNITVSNSFNSGSGNSFGYFSANGSSFPFSEGITLTTGKAVSAVGPNGGILSEGPTSWTGDADLEEALNVTNSVNATVLEFDFLPLGNKISFDYIFASEQYLTNPSPNQCNYTDGFVFLLRKANTNDVYQNLAVIPNTNIPVRVNTVRGSGTVCPSANEEYFGGFNGYDHPTNYNGQTVIMTAQADVEPNALYHIKLVVADQGNNLYDSAIFLGGGSFKIEKDLGFDRLLSTNNPLCGGETVDLDATDPAGTNYQWFVDNVAITGANNPIYQVSAPGTYTVEITLNASACISTGEIVIEYASTPTLSPATLVQCDDNNDGVATFNLTLLDATITNADPNVGGVTYYLTLSDAQSQVNAITNPSAFQNINTSQLTARAQNQYGCANFATVDLQISNNANPNQPELAVCDTDGDGFYAFNLSAADQLVLNTLPSGLTVQYYSTVGDAVTQTNPLVINFTNTNPSQQTIYARVIDGPDCYGIVPVLLKINSIDTTLFDSELIALCENSTTVLSAPSGFMSYVWSTIPPQNTQNVTISAAGTYSVTATDTNNCSATKTFTISVSEAPQYESVDISDFAGSGNSVLINYSGNGDYEFSLDGSYYQSNPYFAGLIPGQYSVYIRDTNFCGNVGPIVIYVLDNPPFFTPNNDGQNDFWNIPYLQRQPNSSVSIFDRYGKLLYTFGGNDMGWDGKLNGVSLPATDYWFVLRLDDGRTIKGHFALKR